jgi:hypothetical protein
MLQTNIDSILDMPIDAMDFLLMIGDVKDFLTFSEENIGWQHRRELQTLSLRHDLRDEAEYRDHLEESANHRFQVSLPLKVRYSALLSFVTSVEWSVAYLNRSLKIPFTPKKKGINETVEILGGMTSLVSVTSDDVIADYDALVKLRNCIAHTGGIVDSYKHKEDIRCAAERIEGITIESRHFFGPQIYIAGRALDAPIERTLAFVISLHKELCEKGHQK